tara:strand:+ start:51 stop:827 length:777 start_codon:yes stop_codon:yes gene_type:complete
MSDYQDIFSLNDCTAVVAGGASGLGLEMSKALLSNGCRVAIIGRTEERILAVSETLSEEYNTNCLGIVGDISDENTINQVVESISEVYEGKLNIAVNSAGINVRNEITKVSLKEWNQIQKVNLTGAFLFAKGLFPVLVESNFGRLINITSIFSSRSFAERVSYASSKGGLLQLTRTLAIEWAAYPITVNAISPGPFLTDINRPLLENPKQYRKFCESIPLGRFGDPQEIVSACLFLCSRHSSYVTGANILVDGGWTVR